MEKNTMLLPSPQQLKKEVPINASSELFIQESRKIIRNIITGTNPTFSIILGPCSLHNTDSAIEYAKRVKELQKRVKQNCLLVMRAHIEKPRSHLGWKGLLHDPQLKGSENITEGIIFCRELLVKLALLEVPLATEFLDPLASTYFTDLISWGFIGARTVSSQTHRQLASHLPMPIGFKNTTEGNIESAVHGALFAKRAHSFLHVDETGKIAPVLSQGNPYSHIVLRGSKNEPNYTTDKVNLANTLSHQNSLKNKLLIDCSHGNSEKNHNLQEKAFHSVLNQRLSNPNIIMGTMIESHLEGGNQSCSTFSNPSISITDSCIDWSLTEELVISASTALELCSTGSSSS